LEKYLKVLNLSDTSLQESYIDLLSKGCSFTVRPNEDIASFFVDFFFFTRTLRFKYFFENSNTVNNRVQSAHIKYSRTHNSPPTSKDSQFEEEISSVEKLYTVAHDNIARNQRTNHNFRKVIALRKINNLKFTKADKGGCLIVLNKHDYENMVLKHLSDNTTYKLLPESIDIDVHNKVKDLVESFNKCFARDELSYLLNHAFDSSSFYVLPKIHKSKIIAQACSAINNNYLHLQYVPPDLPSRPIVSNINSPTSRLSHFIDSLLKPLVPLVPSYVKDSFDFLAKNSGKFK